MISSTPSPSALPAAIFVLLCAACQNTQPSDAARSQTDTSAPGTAQVQAASTLHAPSAEAPVTPAAMRRPSEPLSEAGTEINPQLAATTNPPVSENAGAPTVKRLVIASGVVEREPLALVDAQVDEPVVAFVELSNKSEQERTIVVTFEHESGKEVGFIELTVPGESPRYRTWGRTRNIKEPGKWDVVVVGKGGQELARESFSVAG